MRSDLVVQAVHIADMRVDVQIRGHTSPWIIRSSRAAARRRSKG